MAKLLLACFALFAVCSAFPNFDITRKYLPWKQGSCVKNAGFAHFQPEEFFTGHWYEYSSFGNYLLQADGICTTIESEIRKGDVSVLYYQYEPILKKYVYFRSTTPLKDVVGSSFSLQYDIFAGMTSISIPFSVLSTDYKNYTILYSCQEAFGFKAEASWLLTRERGVFNSELEVKQVLDNFGIRYLDYIPQDYQNCGPNEPHL